MRFAFFVSRVQIIAESGVTFPEWDETDEAANAVADAFFEERYGDCKLPPEVIEEINAEGKELAAALDEAGVSYELVTGPDGVTYPEWADDAGDEVAEQFFGEHECDDDEDGAAEEEVPEDEPAAVGS